MAQITINIDDKTKQTAEYISEMLGMSLDTVINVLIKQFVVYQGFPFLLKASPNPQPEVQVALL